MKNLLSCCSWLGLILCLFLNASDARAQAVAHLSQGMAVLAPDFLVVVGKGAPDAEMKAAQSIAAALRAAGGPADNLLDDETALTDYNRSAFHHLILVGTYSSNVLLRQQWGHWSIDRKAFNREHEAPADTLKAPFYSGAPKDGFFVFGVGTFHDDATGIIEVGRNDLCMVPAALDAPKKPGYKISLHITGVDSEGVARAAAAFLQSGLLNGVIPASGEKLPATGDAFVLAQDQFGSTLPAWVPSGQLLGWLQPDATEYGGFRQASGQEAKHIWRAKYLTAATIADFSSSPEKKTSANELWMAQMATPEAAQAAMTGLIKTLNNAPEKTTFAAGTVAGKPVQHAALRGINGAQPIDGTTTSEDHADFYIGTNGPWLFMETLPAAQGMQVLGAVLNAPGL